MKNKYVLVVFSLWLALFISFLPGSQNNTVSAEPAVCVPGPHSGNVSAGEIWCLEDSPHIVISGVTVPFGTTLTIEPGVEVKFTSGASLGVVGNLIANGTATKPIKFTSNLPSPAPGNWLGILAVAGSNLQLSYTELAYAGQPGFAFGALAIYTTNATVSHSRIHHNSGTAVYLNNNGITPQFNDVEVDHNSTGVGLYQATVSMNPVYQNIRLHDNAWDGLQMAGGITDRDVSLDGSAAAFNGTPIYISDSVRVLEGTTMTIMPGTTLMVNGGIAVPSTAKLIADGTPGTPIIFTSWKSVPQPGDWSGISADFGSTLQLSYCELAYAGRAGFDFGSLTVRTSGATVSHCRIHDVIGTAVYLNNNGITPQFNDVEIDHNSTGVGLYQATVSMNPVYQNIRLHDNALNALQLPGGMTNRNITLDGSPAALNGAPIFMNYGFTVGAGTTTTITPGTILQNNEGISVLATAALIAEGTPAAPIVFTSWKGIPQPGDWGGINAASGSTLRLSYCEVGYTGRPGGALGAVYIATADAIVRQCRIHNSSGPGIYIAGASPFPLWSNVLTDNSGVALDVEGGGDLEALHTTLARNGVGLYVPNGSAVLTNTIIANNNIGVQQADQGTITLSYTLFQGNTSPVLGTVSDTHHINGSAAFEADGYHISKGSDAIDAGAVTAVNNDIEGDPRAIGPTPDLGADEYRDAIAPIDDVNGGILTYTDEQGNPTIVTFPAGAVSQDTVLVLKVIDAVTPPLTYLRSGHAFYMEGYRGGIRVPGLQFLLPVNVSLHYSDADVKGMDERSFTLWYWNGSAWSGAACGGYEHHPNENWLTVPICHLSRFSFFGQFRVQVPVIMR